MRRLRSRASAPLPRPAPRPGVGNRTLPGTAPDAQNVLKIGQSVFSGSQKGVEVLKNGQNVFSGSAIPAPRRHHLGPIRAEWHAMKMIAPLLTCGFSGGEKAATTCMHASKDQKPLPGNTFCPIFSTKAVEFPPENTFCPIFSTSPGRARPRGRAARRGAVEPPHPQSTSRGTRAGARAPRGRRASVGKDGRPCRKSGKRRTVRAPAHMGDLSPRRRRRRARHLASGASRAAITSCRRMRSRARCIFCRLLYAGGNSKGGAVQLFGTFARRRRSLPRRDARHRALRENDTTL